jgi:hypothetical protein
MTRTSPTSPRGRPILLICTPIGSAEHVEPGTPTGDCSDCRRPVWVLREALDLARRDGRRPTYLCGRCYRARRATEGKP